MKNIGIIALSGNCDKESILNSVKYFENKGFGVKLSSNIFNKNRYLAGDDDTKIEELNKFFLDPEIDIIMAARGGYGAIRLINKINYDLIKNNKKIFIGYSDVTALLLMLYKNSNLITYHGVMAQSDFGVSGVNVGVNAGVNVGVNVGVNQGANGIDKFTEQSFFDAISDKKQTIECSPIKSGNAKGILWGGNLSTVVSLCGQDFIPNEDFLFFTEDINEPVYKIDKMFQQLINIEQFKKYCKGIIVGEFIGVDNQEWLNEYFVELSEKLNIPFISNPKITHGKSKMTLPIGKLVQLKNNTMSYMVH